MIKPFAQLYTGRKRLLDNLPEDSSMIATYCNKAGRFEKDAVYYLTDSSQKEKQELLYWLNHYEYSDEELMQITQTAFPELALYLKKFSFSPINTKIKDSALLDMLTAYFDSYKKQKVRNQVLPAFVQQVESIAVKRPYNKLQRRSSLLHKTQNDCTQIFFFDALGVEYLSYIEEKAKEYGLISEISVGKCELPSITAQNKEFVEQCGDSAKKIDELDELKHHSQVIDYQKCKLPIHLFVELAIIDKHLQKIKSMLIQGDFDQAVIVSDHGASRLAVIYEHESKSPFVLDEKGEHSGRCCPADSNPNIDCVAYENGYAILANYERFKGGRKANVEVHGGATLEEVVIPVITLSKKPDSIEICFTNSIVELKQKEVAKITVFSNIPLQNAKMVVKDKDREFTYSGEAHPDNRHLRFEMPDFKRSKKELLADIYDGSKKLASNLPFQIQKKTGREVNFF